MSEPKYKPEYCERLIKYMGQGYSYASFSTQIDDPCCRATLYSWENLYPEWKIAKKKAHDKNLQFFESLLVSNMTGVLPASLKKMGSKGTSLSAIIFALKTRHHDKYSEKNQLEITSGDRNIEISFVEPPVKPVATKKKKVTRKKKK